MKRYECLFLVLAMGWGCGSTENRPPPLTNDAGDVPADITHDVTATDAVADAARADVVSDTADASSDATEAPRDALTDATVDATTDVLLDAPDVVRPTDATIPDVGGPMDAVSDGPDGTWRPIAGGSCNARERNVATQDSPHVDPDAGPVLYLTNPPASGPHFNEWARWGAFRNIARGNWVHNLEHGGVAFLYRCPTGTCDATVTALVTAMNSIPMDPACMPDDAAPARVRVVITNDNAIETPVAAAAWGWLYAADCVDAPSLREFYRRHAGMAPEDFCFDGTVPAM
jgi:hypothetical protein